MSRGLQARDAIKCRAEVVVIPLLSLTRMERHPHPNGTGLTPLLSLKRQMRIQSSVRGVQHGSKSGTKGVSDGLKDMAAMPFNRISKEFVVARKGKTHRLGTAFPQPGAALD